MAQETYYTYDTVGARTVEAKGDIGDFITILARDEHPLLALFAREGTKDIMPQVLEDNLSAVDNANAHAQGAAAPASVDTTRSLVYNYTQRMLKTAAVSTTQQAIAQYGIPGKELTYQEVKKARELLRDAEATLVSDQAMQAPTLANGRIGLMAGIGAIITTTVNTNALTQIQYDNNMITVYAAGGNPTRCFCDATYRTAINKWTTTPTRYTPDIKHLEREILTYHSSLGPNVAFEYHHLLPQDIVGNAPHLLVIDPSLWMIKELTTMNRRTLPDPGGGPSTLFEWEWTVLCKAEKGNFSFEV